MAFEDHLNLQIDSVEDRCISKISKWPDCCFHLDRRKIFILYMKKLKVHGCDGAYTRLTAPRRAPLFPSPHLLRTYKMVNSDDQ